MSRYRLMTLVRTSVSCVLALGVASCGSDTSATPVASAALLASIPEHGENPALQAKTTYVGKVTGSNALTAVVVDGSVGVAYVCDGAEISEWFTGTKSGTTIQLEGRRGGSLSAVLTNGVIQGNVSLASAQGDFSAAAAVENESGIYRSREDGELTGWIFFDGELRGASEDSGKGIVGTASLSNIDEATGSGTGLAEPPPPVQFTCGGAWCAHERQRCLISNINEQKAALKGKALLQANQMVKHAQKKLNEIGDELTNNNCSADGSSCSDTGYDSPQDTPSC